VILERSPPTLRGAKRRALRRFARADRSPLGPIWLALRPLRRIWGRDETFGVEKLLARSILAGHLARVGIGSGARR
jgi:hypothetical protein